MICIFVENSIAMYDNWFKASSVFTESNEDKHTIGFQIQKDHESDISIGTTVALLGYDSEIADAVRRDLYQCSYNFDKLQLMDLGNLRKKDLDFTVQILSELNKAGLNIIVLGPDNTFLSASCNAVSSPHYVGYVEKAGSMLFDPANKKQIFENELVKKTKLIAYQSHLFHKKFLEDKKLSQSLSLGDLRNNMRDAEPVLRDIDQLNFMLESIRYSELPGIKNTSPSGLTSEEACQLMRYLGLNPKRNQLCLFGYDPKYDFHNQGVKMVSQLIWYYLEGLDQKKLDKPDLKENMIQYLVELSDYNMSLAFWKSDYSGRWWVEIPEEDETTLLLPCSYLDYKLACNNEMPKRIMKELQ
jgi:hypothetical protein